MPKRRYDANWNRLKIETKVKRLKQRVEELEKLIEETKRSGSVYASTALYVANLSR